MCKPTISQIKERTKETNPHFFSRKTMRFFGQTLRSWKVTLVNQRVIISAPIRAKGMTLGLSIWEVTKENDLIPLDKMPTP